MRKCRTYRRSVPAFVFLLTIAFVILLGSVLGSLCVAVGFFDFSEFRILQLVQTAGSSMQQCIFLSLVYCAIMLCAMSPLFYPLFYAGLLLCALSASFCSALFIMLLSWKGAALSAWFFLPRLLIVCYGAEYFAQCLAKRRSAVRMPLYMLALVGLLFLQTLLFPSLVLPLI
ncbi:MAG: hypothetical protein LBM28_01745 [Oscillospiraceae bacterium]|jgi:hypothetical protein|nr:hypothetical protein [Oscillospiraceae bacterium]